MEHLKKAHYDLDELKGLIRNPETCIITSTSRQMASELGYVTYEEIIEQVLKIER